MYGHGIFADINDFEKYIKNHKNENIPYKLFCKNMIINNTITDAKKIIGDNKIRPRQGLACVLIGKQEPYLLHEQLDICFDYLGANEEDLRIVLMNYNSNSKNIHKYNSNVLNIHYISKYITKHTIKAWLLWIDHRINNIEEWKLNALFLDKIDGIYIWFKLFTHENSTASKWYKQNKNYKIIPEG